MKITKQQLKQIIKEELSEITAAQAGTIPPPSRKELGTNVVKQHLGEMGFSQHFLAIANEFIDKGLIEDPRAHGLTGFEPNLERLAGVIYEMIMVEMGAT